MQAASLDRARSGGGLSLRPHLKSVDYSYLTFMSQYSSGLTSLAFCDGLSRTAGTRGMFQDEDATVIFKAHVPRAAESDTGNGRFRQLQRCSNLHGDRAVNGRLGSEQLLPLIWME